MNTTPSQSPAIPVALATFDKLPESAHVRVPVATAWLGISAPTLWRWVKSGRLVAVKLGPNTTGITVSSLRRTAGK